MHHYVPAPVGALPSQGRDDNNKPGLFTGGDFGLLTVLLSDLVNKLDSGAPVCALPLDAAGFSGFHTVSVSDVEYRMCIVGESWIS